MPLPSIARLYRYVIEKLLLFTGHFRFLLDDFLGLRVVAKYAHGGSNLNADEGA